MTDEQLKTMGDTLARILEDNLGNRITVTLANGILAQLGQQLQAPPLPPMTPPKE
jgi:hypothetical protein